MVEQPDHNKTVEGQQRGLDAEEASINQKVTWPDGSSTTTSPSGGAKGVRFASSFSGSTGGAQIQNAIDDLPAEGGVVVVGPDGPDAGSDVTDGAGVYVDSGDAYEIQSGASIWLRTQRLTVPSNVTVYLQGATIVQQDGTNTQTFANSTAGDGTTNRNTDVQVIGDGNAVIHGNTANQTEQNNPPDNGIHLHKVDNFVIGGFRLIATEGWGLTFEHINQRNGYDVGHIRNVQFVQDTRGTNPDGIHIVGPSNNIYAAQITGAVVDDFFAIDPPATNRAYDTGGGGNINHCALDGFQAYSLDVGDLLKLVADGTDSQRHITVRNGYYEALGTSQTVMAVGSSGNLNKIEHITLQNIDFENAAGLNFNGGGARDVVVDGLQSNSLSGKLVNNGGNTVSGLKISNFDVRATQQPPGIIELQNTEYRDVKVRNGVIRTDLNRSTAGVYLDGTLENIDISGVSIVGNESGTMAEGVNVQSTATINGRIQVDVDINEAGVSTPYNVSSYGPLFHDAGPRTNYGGLQTYTGDGTTGRTINLGFAPTYVAVRDSAGTWFDVHSEFGNGFEHSSPTGELSIASNGFTVGDGGSDADPNTSTEVYDVYYEV